MTPIQQLAQIPANRLSDDDLIAIYDPQNGSTYNAPLGFLRTAGILGTLSAVAQARAEMLAAYKDSPMIVGVARINSNAYVAAENVPISRTDGVQMLCTANGNSAAAEPNPFYDGRPNTDGTATMYHLGFTKKASDPGAPTITESAATATITGAGMTVFQDFVSGDALPNWISTADAVLYNRTNAYVGAVQAVRGVPPLSGNAGVTNATAIPVAGLAASGVVYANSLVEFDFYVEDSKFAVIGNAASGYLAHILIDGKMVNANKLTCVGTNGIIFDFNGVSKKRRVTIATCSAVEPQLGGIYTTPQGRVSAVERTGDVMLILGDSFNDTTSPNVGPNFSFFLKRELGLEGLVNACVGGSGYTQAVTTGGRYTHQQVLDDPNNILMWNYYKPRHVMFNGAGNDGGQPAASIQAAALAAWRRARELFPAAKITVTTGNSGDSGPGANELAAAAAIRTAFTQWADPNSRLIETMGTGATDALIWGTTHAGQALGTGNSSFWTGTDSAHPSPGGTRYLARSIANLIRLAWNNNY